MLNGFFVITAWRKRKLRMGETASAYGKQLQKYWGMDQPIKGGPPTDCLTRVINFSQQKLEFYKISGRTSETDGHFGKTYAMEKL